VLFNPDAIREKTLHLDSILSRMELVERVLAANLDDSSGPIRVKQVPRVWEPGGGATLFEVTAGADVLFLKVKRLSVLVESKLESEPAFSPDPSLRNEAAFLKSLQVEWIPRLRFYEERDGYGFLAVEKLEGFASAVKRIDAEGVIRAWERIEGAVRHLYEQGILHTDIHEHNICFRGTDAMICDFEEARYFKQSVPFESSLDVVGRRGPDDVGEFPRGKSSVEGLTCLERLRSVFNGLIRERLPALLAECKFDDACPFNRDALQESDPRVYQSIALPGLKVRGQRPLRDPRLPVVQAALGMAGSQQKLRYIDIGSNLGMFCFMAARLPFVDSSLGLEAFEPYVRCANVLRFLSGGPKTRFEKFVCGEQDLAQLIPGADFVTMLSVYHHVGNKDLLLGQLRQIGVQYLMTEFATQERYYPERGNLAKELDHIQQVTALRHRFVVGTTRDYKRPFVLFSAMPLDSVSRLRLRLTFLIRKFV
jgi:predicted Ser/Thr protein kinase